MKCQKQDLLLYAITDRSWLHGQTLCQQVEKALQGGVTFLQLRDKDLPMQEFLEEAIEIQKLCAHYQVPFIINDYVEVARAIHANGVHVGQGDMDALAARERLGRDQIVGVSARTVEQALLAQEHGADYLGVGAVFPTGTKKDTVPVSKEQLKAICEAVSIPVVAIGGITNRNLAQLAGSGISGIAVVSAIFAQPDITRAANDLKRQAAEIIKG